MCIVRLPHKCKMLIHPTIASNIHYSHWLLQQFHFLYQESSRRWKKWWVWCQFLKSNLNCDDKMSLRRIELVSKKHEQSRIAYKSTLGYFQSSSPFCHLSFHYYCLLAKSILIRMKIKIWIFLKNSSQVMLCCIFWWNGVCSSSCQALVWFY